MNPESCCLSGGSQTSCKDPRGTPDNPGTIARCLQLYQSKEGGSDGQYKAWWKEEIDGEEGQVGRRETGRKETATEWKGSERGGEDSSWCV